MKKSKLFLASFIIAGLILSLGHSAQAWPGKKHSSATETNEKKKNDTKKKHKKHNKKNEGNKR